MPHASMKTSLLTLLAAVAVAGLSSGCGESDAPPRDTEPAVAVKEAIIPSVSQIETWQQEIDQFDGGYRPTGSQAHEGYIKLLTKELSSIGVSDVHTEPYTFTKWTPSTFSLTLLNGPSAGPVTVSGYVPYSGSTGPLGVQTGLVYLPSTGVKALSSLDPASISQALSDPDQWAKALLPDVQASLSAAGGVVGKVVLFDVPRLMLPAGAMTGPTRFVNDPNGALPSKIGSVELSAMLYVPAVLNALVAAGALGAVGILDCPEQAARGEYAPFFGAVSPNMPSLYVDRATGDKLKQTLAIMGPFLGARLILDASLASVTSENIVGLIPGASPKEILLSSHTDGPNSLEDNGPAAILALATYFEQLPEKQRQRSIRIVLTGGHFIGSRGIAAYLLEHTGDLTANALAVMELEHLGAKEWAEVSPGTMGLTGRFAPQILYTWENAPLVDESIAFAKQFPGTAVAGPWPLGEGQNFRVVPLMQFITMPEYLLVGHLPEVTTQFTDYDLMRKQIVAFAQMEQNLASAPAEELGVVPH